MIVRLCSSFSQYEEARQSIFSDTVHPSISTISETPCCRFVPVQKMSTLHYGRRMCQHEYFHWPAHARSTEDCFTCRSFLCSIALCTTNRHAIRLVWRCTVCRGNDVRHTRRDTHRPTKSVHMHARLDERTLGRPPSGASWSTDLVIWNR